MFLSNDHDFSTFNLDINPNTSQQNICPTTSNNVITIQITEQTAIKIVLLFVIIFAIIVIIIKLLIRKIQSPEVNTNTNHLERHIEGHHSVTHTTQTLISTQNGKLTKKFQHKMTIQTSVISRGFSRFFPHGIDNKLGGLRYGYVNSQGRRKHMENCECIIPNLMGYIKPIVYFAVFDGHNGDNVAKFCKETFHKIISEQINCHKDNPQNKNKNIKNPHQDLINRFAKNDKKNDKKNDTCTKNKKEIEAEKDWICKCIHNSFIIMDKIWSTKHSLPHDESGSAAVVALIIDDNLYVGNVGDCGLLLCRENKGYFLTEEHKPSNINEKKRILREGGTISCDDTLNSNLSLSRAIGDYKNGIKEIGLSCIPNITKVKLTKQDEFMVIGCDGLWDSSKYENNKEVHYKNILICAQDKLRTKNFQSKLFKNKNFKNNHNNLNKCEAAAKNILQYRKKQTLCDNISIIVVGFGDKNGTIVKPKQRKYTPYPGDN